MQVNGENENLKHSMKGTDELIRKIAHIKTVGRKQGRSEADIQADVKAAVDEVSKKMQQEKEECKKGKVL